MPIYRVGLAGNVVRNSFQQSPVIALETDLASAEQVPEAVRSAADSFLPGSLDAFATGEISQAAVGVITWFGGDRLFQGSAATIRFEMRTQGRRCFVPVHFPCLPAIDLLSVQPRWITSGRPRDYWGTGVRILGNSSPSPLVQSVLRSACQPWAQLVQTLLAEQAMPGSGIEALDRLSKDGRIPSLIAALALRNLAVLLIRHNELQKAEQTLEVGAKAYPGYAELSYVAAVLCFRQQKPSKAVALLKQDRPVNRAFVGSGGEDSYRRGWLMGLLAAGVGNQAMAFEHFRMGMVSKPVFAPAVDELLKLRCSPSHVKEHQWDFCRLVRREPRYLEPVINYLLLHRAFSAVRRIAETMPLSEDKKSVLLRRLESAALPFRPAINPIAAKPGIMLCGPFFEHSSTARINREI